MTELRFTVETPVPQDAVIAAFTDFSDRRPHIWPALDAAIYEVRELRETSAVVREGQRRPHLWAIEEYDWSTPGTVTWTARASNFCAPGSFMSARVTPAEGNGSRLEIRWSRRGVGLKGRAVVGMMRLTRGRPLAAALAGALERLPRETAPEERTR